MRHRAAQTGRPSPRLLEPLAGDLVGYRRETHESGLVRFTPSDGGPVIEVTSRIEKRFLGRTEVAVFAVQLNAVLPEGCRIELRHTGGLKRTGIAPALVEGGEAGRHITASLSDDTEFTAALMPLDFTRFEISCGPSGCRVEVELMGASHVAIALPPIRSYVRLHTDQREAMERAFAATERAIHAAV